MTGQNAANPAEPCPLTAASTPATVQLGSGSGSSISSSGAEIAAEARLAQLRRQYRVLSASNRSLIHAVSEHELLTGMFHRALIDIGGYRHAWVGYLTHAPATRASGTSLRSPPGVDARSAPDPSQLETRCIAIGRADDRHCCFHDAAGNGRLQIVRDIQDERWSGERGNLAHERAASADGHAAAWAMPKLLTFGLENCLGVLEDAIRQDDPCRLQEVIGSSIAQRAGGGPGFWHRDPAHSTQEYERQQNDIALLTRVLKMQSAVSSGGTLRIRRISNACYCRRPAACSPSMSVADNSAGCLGGRTAAHGFARPGFRAGTRMPNVGSRTRLFISDGKERGHQTRDGLKSITYRRRSGCAVI